MSFFEYMEEVKKMDLPLGEYAILGSGPLAVRGIRETKDIDLIVTLAIYTQYKEQEKWDELPYRDTLFLKNGPVELWERIGFLEDKRINIQGFIDRAEMIMGLPFVNLYDFIYWKKIADREKDKRDVILAEEYLASH